VPRFRPRDFRFPQRAQREDEAKKEVSSSKEKEANRGENEANATHKCEVGKSSEREHIIRSSR
jgi:hypothetical protein